MSGGEKELGLVKLDNWRPPMIGRTLVGLAVLAVVGFAALALIAVWDRPSLETTAPGSGGT